MDPEGSTSEEGSASPGSVEIDDIVPMPPSPCLHEFGDDDATPRQQWSPVQTLIRASSHPYESCITSSLTASGNRSGASGGESTAGPDSGDGSCGKLKDVAGCAEKTAAPPTREDSSGGDRPCSPVMRVDDLERLDLSALHLGEERECSATRIHDLNPDTFSSEPSLTQAGFGWRSGSGGGRPSCRTQHGLFVAPGHFVPGASSPPSSYSAHSESCSGFTSPSTRASTSPSVPQDQGRVRKGHWKKGRPIGVGSCGNVYLGMNEDNGKLIAVKEITLEARERQLCSLYNEIQVMHKLVHPHIVGYLGAELQDSQRKLCIFQEWVPAGSLHSLLDQFGALSDAMTRKYTRQVLDGLSYLHANRVIHRDVKCKNILVDDRGNVKLADFGCALVLKDDHSNDDGVEMSMKGTPLFMAPEMLLKRKCGRRVDIWSLGCAVIEMITTRPPWADIFKHPVEIIQHFSENPGPPALPSNLPPALGSFLDACFTWDAELRPSAQELCGHHYLRRQPPLPAADGNPGDDVPLEEMDRATAVTRMRRCSSATLDLLAVQARKAAIGGSIGGALAAFGTAPSGTFRPPSPRYGPVSLATHNKRTPTRRRMYTEAFLASPENVAPGVPTVRAAVFGLNSPGVSGITGAEVTRTFSMHATRSPPVSPDKPRRPGRGCSAPLLGDEEGPFLLPARLRSTNTRSGIDRSTSCRSFCSVDSESGGGDGQGYGGARPRFSFSARRNSCSEPAVPVNMAIAHDGPTSTVPSRGAGVGPSSTATPAFGYDSPMPAMPPLGQEVLGTVVDTSVAAGGSDLDPSHDTPPPTVRPLELRLGTSTRETGASERAPYSGSHSVLEESRSDSTDSKGSWGVSIGMSDARTGVSRRNGEQRHSDESSDEVVGSRASSQTSAGYLC